MKIAIGNDRNGIDYKIRLTAHLESLGHSVVNCGTDEDFPADYPVHGEKVGRLVASGECDRGVVICATGIGICMAAGKVKGIRAGMAYSDDVARLMRTHNNANVIGFGQDYMTYEEVEKRMDTFLNTEYAGGYHDTRIQQIADIEENKPIQQTPIMNDDNRHTKGK
ncbi:sugar-phosphate isomerase, RpiB/LacA/LacB family [Lachnospiraceae bacterium JC7]|nr:sugar-phosphate isomerase, RpiB/LacA/LacB family [Lachnospiraceae bacterium JC7]